MSGGRIIYPHANCLLAGSYGKFSPVLEAFADLKRLQKLHARLRAHWRRGAS